MSRLPLLLLLLVAACSHPPKPAAIAPKLPFGMKAWDEAIADTEAIAGLVPVRLRRDHAVLLELGPETLDRDLGVMLSIARGVGAYGVLDGAALGHSQLIRLTRVGDRVYAIRRDPGMVASEGSGLDVAIARDQGESVIGVMPVISEGPDGRVLADATRLFASDYADVAAMFKPIYGATPETTLTLDPDRSFVERVRGFPANVELDATITLTSPQAPTGLLPLEPTDPRVLSVGVRWSVFALPETPMPTREADDRIGYWVEPQLDWDRATITNDDAVVDHIRRWRLEQADPGAARSKPVTPIRYVLDPSIPEAYRSYVRDGVLAWNKAFEAAGWEDAIVVVDPPADFDYLDMRYSSVHWVATADLPYYAYGPSQVDPRTGEILNADIIVIADFLRTTGSALRSAGAPGACAAAEAVGDGLLLGELAGVDPTTALPDAIRAIVMHEVGHTIGLRHNFRSSASVPRARLGDRAWLDEHGVAASIMDYAPFNFDPAGEAPLQQDVVGDYDVFAIRYGYMVTDAAGLAAIADESALPANAYGADEDNWLDAWAPDPATSGFDLGDDPVAFGADWVGRIDRLLPAVPDRVIADGESWQPARDAVTQLLYSRTRALLNVVRAVGGVTVRRAHRGDPTPPMTAIAADVQRQALALVIAEGFAEHAYQLTPEVLAVMAPRREHTSWAQLEQGMVVPVDLPIHRVILDHQQELLRALLAAPRLERIIDNTARVTKDAFPLSELFTTLTAGTFGELDQAKPAVTSARRNLQRAYVDELIAIVTAPAVDAPAEALVSWSAPPPVLPPPADARALARHELAALTKRAAKLAPKAGDADTRAHLEELAARIDDALDPD